MFGLFRRHAPRAEDALAPRAERAQGDWASLPPLERTTADLELTAPTARFLPNLSGRRAPELSVGPLAHDVRLEAPAGIATGIARAVESSDQGRPPLDVRPRRLLGLFRRRPEAAAPAVARVVDAEPTAPFVEQPAVEAEPPPERAVEAEPAQPAQPLAAAPVARTLDPAPRLETPVVAGEPAGPDPGAETAPLATPAAAAGPAPSAQPEARPAATSVQRVLRATAAPPPSRPLIVAPAVSHVPEPIVTADLPTPPGVHRLSESAPVAATPPPARPGTRVIRRRAGLGPPLPSGTASEGAEASPAAGGLTGEPAPPEPSAHLIEEAEVEPQATPALKPEEPTADVHPQAEVHPEAPLVGAASPVHLDAPAEAGAGERAAAGPAPHDAAFPPAAVPGEDVATPDAGTPQPAVMPAPLELAALPVRSREAGAAASERVVPTLGRVAGESPRADDPAEAAGPPQDAPVQLVAAAPEGGSVEEPPAGAAGPAHDAPVQLAAAAHRPAPGGSPVEEPSGAAAVERSPDDAAPGLPRAQRHVPAVTPVARYAAAASASAIVSAPLVAARPIARFHRRVDDTTEATTQPRAELGALAPAAVPVSWDVTPGHRPEAAAPALATQPPVQVSPAATRAPTVARLAAARSESAPVVARALETPPGPARRSPFAAVAGLPSIARLADEPDGAAVPPVPAGGDSEVPSVQLAAAETAPAPDTAPAAASGPPGAAQSPESMDELAGRIYDRIRMRFRDELLIDRERAGLLTDVR